jgi:hypothetical protein
MRVLFTNAIIPEYRSSKLIDRASRAMFTYALVIDGHCNFIFCVSNHISLKSPYQMPYGKRDTIRVLTAHRQRLDEAIVYHHASWLSLSYRSVIL